MFSDVIISEDYSIEESLNMSLNQLRKELLACSERLISIDKRIESVLWPLFSYESIVLADFEKKSMCLYSDSVERKIYLSRTISCEIFKHVLPPNNFLAVSWFCLHQLVHITQGLTYQSFKDLNKSGSREHMTRLDCWADFISLKTLALFITMQKAEHDHSNLSDIGFSYVPDLFNLTKNVLPPSIGIIENMFIPVSKDLEIQRVMSLLLMMFYVEESFSKNHNSIIDSSVFPQWINENNHLYIWLGYDQLIGRSHIEYHSCWLDNILVMIRKREIDKAYLLLKQLNLPEL